MKVWPAVPHAMSDDMCLSALQPGNRATFVHLGYRIGKLKDPGINMLIKVSDFTK